MCTGTIHMHCGKKKRSCLICLDFFPHHRAESVSTSGEWPETRFPAISRTTQSAFPLVPRLRPGLEKLKTEAGGCIKVHSGKLLNKLDIWYGYINLDLAPRKFNRHILASFYPTLENWLPAISLSGRGWHPMIRPGAISRRCFDVGHQPTSFEGFPEPM